MKKNILLFLLFLSLVFSEKIEFESANPFSFRDIIQSLDSQDAQLVSGILKLPSKTTKNQKFPLIIGVAGSLG